jgi:hypothetical protein
MAAEQEQSTSDCPEGSVYNEALDSCIDPNLNLGSFNQSSVNGIDLSAITDTKPDTVIEGEDGNMYRTNPFYTPSGWQTVPDYDTPVYFFHQPLELGDARGNYYELDDNGRLDSQFGTWRTEEEIKGYWEADEGMGYFKEANPNLDVDTWFNFIKESSTLSQQGLNRNDNPDEFDALVSQYGISTSFQNPDGDIFEWNGSSFTKTFKVDDSIPVGDMIMSVAIGAMTAGALGPVFGGGFTGGAASGAVGSTLSQGVINGKIDPTAVVTAGVLGGIGGYFDELTAATPGAYGGWVDAAGNQLGSNSQWMIEKVQGLSNLLGIPFNEASGIVQGVISGTVTGEDLEGIAINAVGGWSEARIKGFLTNTFGDGADVENWFREGDSFIPTDALFPFVETAIQGAIDGGVSKVDLLKMLGGYFQAGGDLDFILPGLPDLDLGSAFPELDYDFCEQFPEFPGLCKDIDLGPGPDVDIDEFGCTVDEEWNTELLQCLPKGNISVDIDEFGCTVDEEWNTELRQCLPKVNGPNVGGTGGVPELTCEPTPVPNGQQTYIKNTSLNECIPDVIECIEGFDLVGQKCVKISVETPNVSVDLPDLCSEPRPEEYGFGQINWDKYCKVPEINCDAGQEYNTELRKCVDINVDSPDVDVDLDVDLDFDTPSFPSLGNGGGGTGTDPVGVSYNSPMLTPMIAQGGSIDAAGQLNAFITRQFRKKQNASGGGGLPS